MSFQKAIAGKPLAAPTEQLREAGFRTSLFQGSCVGIDPRTNFAYLYQFQAVRKGPGDIEDLRIHRFHISTDFKEVIYLDTMTVLQGGHVQQGHVRISEAGNAYLWLGLERYDRNGKQTGADTYRVLYKTGNKIIARTNDAVQRVYTGDGNTCAPIDCPDWTIVLRRPGAAFDTFEWHQEKDLLSASVQKAARAGRKPKPKLTIKINKKKSDDDYQSSCATGKWNDVGKRTVFRVTGASTIRVENSNGGVLDFTAQARKALADPGINVEPEGAFSIGDQLYVAVQSGSIADRNISYFPITW